MEKYHSILICLLFVCIHVSSEEDAFNKMIDRSLTRLENDLNNKTNQIIVNLPDVRFRFKKNFLWMDLFGDVVLEQGRVQSMVGLKKEGEAKLVQTNGGNMIVSLEVSWSNLTLYYDNFLFSYLFIEINDKIQFKVNSNTVYLNATFHYDNHDKCTAKLSSAYFLDFNGFTCELMPTRWYSFMNKYITDFLFKDQAFELQRNVNKHLTANVENLVNQINLCHYLPY